MRRPGPDDLREAADPDAHQLAALALLGLLLPEPGVVDEVHRLLERRGVVAGVVAPAGGRVVRELLRLDEVLHPQLGRILADVVGEDVHHPLDRVDRLGDAERAAIGDAARRLVRVDAVHFDEGVREVVRAGDHVEQPGGVLGRIGRRIAVAVIGDRFHLEAGDLPGLRRAHFGVDVVVAGERIGLEVLRPILDPLDGLTDEERRGDGQDVARIDRHLAAEPAADVVGLHPDVLLGDRQPCAGRHEGHHGPDGVWRLARHVQGQLFPDRIPVGDAAARLDRRDMDPRDVDVLFDLDFGRVQGGVRLRPVARFPVPDVVVLLVLGTIRAEDEGVLLEGLVGIDDDRQRLVVDEHGRDPIGGGVTARRDDRSHLLALVHDRVGGQHHLHVAREGRHPVQLVALEVLARDHRQHAGQLERLARIDALDGGVGIRAPDDVQPKHARQDEVVDVLALAADEPRIFLALDGMAHAPDFGGGLELPVGRLDRHVVIPFSRPPPAGPRRPGLRSFPRRRPARSRSSRADRTPVGSP